MDDFFLTFIHLSFQLQHTHSQIAVQLWTYGIKFKQEHRMRRTNIGQVGVLNISNSLVHTSRKEIYHNGMQK